MLERNRNLAKLSGGYLFPEIRKRIAAFREKHPGIELIHLGIGDTTLPLAPTIVEALIAEATKLGTTEGYTGYGPMEGILPLRQKIASVLYKEAISADEVFISDGAKCDIGRLQVLFGSSARVAIQDPAYPVYVDSSVVMGQTGASQANGYADITYLPCLPENNFFPDLAKAKGSDVLFICSPNNPTGHCATRQELENLVAFALKEGAIIVYDTAYVMFLQDPTLPKSIYEIEGARQCAIEINSFSKMAGFTGVRLGWSVVPKTLQYRNGKSLHADWSRIISTFFNGPSNIVQAGGLAALSPQGLLECDAQIKSYLSNAAAISKTLTEIGIKNYGGANTPYVWAQFGKGCSWEIFDRVLEKTHVISTPGSGFGPAGEGFLRFSSFASKATTERALERLRLWK